MGFPLEYPFSNRFLNKSSIMPRNSQPAAAMESDAPGSRGSRPWLQPESLKIPKAHLAMMGR